MTASASTAPPNAPKPKLLDQVRDCCRVRHMAVSKHLRPLAQRISDSLSPPHVA
jgi:hypothetical protein